MPAGPTYEPIATTTLGSAAAPITFSSIPGTYTDLRATIVIPASPDTSGNVNMTLNGTSTGYSRTILLGQGTSASSSRSTSAAFWRVGNNGFQWTGSNSTPVFYTVDIFSYAGSTNKTALATVQEDLNGSGVVQRSVFLWSNTAAITSLSWTTDAGTNFPVGTVATLYGIKAA